MPAQEVAFLFDTAVIWVYLGVDRDNEEQVAAPYQLDCRWDESRTQMRDQTGKLINVDVQVLIDYDPYIGDVPIGSIMWLGITDDLPATFNGDLMKVVAFQKTHDIRRVEGTTERIIGLVRYKNKLPAVVGS